MRIALILQIVALVVVAVYGAMIHAANPDPMALPGLLSLPVSLVLLSVAVTAFLVGWIPPSLRAWRRRRDVRRLERRIAELEQHVPSYDLHPATPVIPDRTPVHDGDRVPLPDPDR